MPQAERHSLGELPTSTVPSVGESTTLFLNGRQRLRSSCVVRLKITPGPNHLQEKNRFVSLGPMPSVEHLILVLTAQRQLRYNCRCSTHSILLAIRLGATLFAIDVGLHRTRSTNTPYRARTPASFYSLCCDMMPGHGDTTVRLAQRLVR
jgi:hypothetical protein